MTNVSERFCKGIRQHPPESRALDYNVLLRNRRLEAPVSTSAVRWTFEHTKFLVYLCRVCYLARHLRLLVSDQHKTMGVSPKAALEPSSAVALDQPSTEVVFNPENCFDQWLEYVQANHKQFAAQAPETAKEKVSEIYMESLPGSNCEVTFEGVLHFDGHSMGNIRSSGGALVVTKRGRIDA